MSKSSNSDRLPATCTHRAQVAGFALAPTLALLLALALALTTIISPSGSNAAARASTDTEPAQPPTAAAAEATRILQNATALLDTANQTQSRSRQSILDANKTRRQLKKLQAKKRRTNDSAARQVLSEQTTVLTTRLKQEQQQGAELRIESTRLRQRAKKLLEQGIYQKWQSWINSREPLVMDESRSLYMAHNTRIRSVHPNMPTLEANTATAPADGSSMSLQIPTLKAQNAPPDLNIDSFQLSREQNYFAHIEVHTTTSDRAAETVPLNKIHQWRLLLTDMDGAAVSGAKIEITGHMPGHVHGLPTQPVVNREIEPGVYLVEGVKFQMKGWWVMKFHITPEKKLTAENAISNPGSTATTAFPYLDTVTFNLVL